MPNITGNQKIDATLNVITLLVPVFSAVASFFNHLIRSKTNRGEQPSPVLLGVGSVLNVASVNLDKGVQLAKMAMGKSVIQTVVDPSGAGNSPVSPPEAR